MALPPCHTQPGSLPSSCGWGWLPWPSSHWRWVPVLSLSWLGLGIPVCWPSLRWHRVPAFSPWFWGSRVVVVVVHMVGLGFPGRCGLYSAGVGLLRRRCRLYGRGWLGWACPSLRASCGCLVLWLGWSGWLSQVVMVLARHCGALYLDILILLSRRAQVGFPGMSIHSQCTGVEVGGLCQLVAVFATQAQTWAASILA
jgi:hypothetical protein